MAEPDPEDVRMSLGDHLDELRKRLILGFAGPVAIAAVALVFGRQILAWINRPAYVALDSQGLPPQLFNTDGVRVFTLYIKVSLITGLIFGVPWLFYQLWLFIAPGLYKHERRLVYRLIPGSILLSVLGVMFMYYIMLPLMLYFLLGFTLSMPKPNLEPTIIERMLFKARPPIATTEGVEPLRVPVLAADPEQTQLGDMWVKVPERELRVNLGEKTASVRLGEMAAIMPWLTVDQYVGLAGMLALAVALAFQLPLVMLTVGYVGIVDAQQFAHIRKYALFMCVVLSAILTPSGDPLSLSLLAIPLYGLYELGIVLIRWTAPRNKEGPEAEA